MKLPMRTMLRMQRPLPRAGERGQAMTEYAIIAWFGVLMTVVGSHFFLPMIMEAYQFYFDVFFFILNLPIP